MQEDLETKSDVENDEDLLATAREHFALAEEADRENRELALDDLRFAAGEQWPEEVKRQREIDNRPCLTINRVPQFKRQVINDLRQNRPAIKISPVDDKADIETAKIRQGLIRHIEYSSDADTAYDTGGGSAVESGKGFARVVTEYCDPNSFDQEIRIKSIRNRFSVYLDPSYQNPDGSDARWGFVFEDMPRDVFEQEYPDAKEAASNDWESRAKLAPGWVQEKTVRVAEYFYLQPRKDTLCLLNTGETKLKSELPRELPPQFQIEKERPTTVQEVKWIKTNGIEILERRDWAGKWIPIVPFHGEIIDIDGKKLEVSLVRYVKDSQRMYNFNASAEAEAIALAPKAPYIGYAGQFEGFEQDWRTANTRNHAYLQVNPTMINGAPAPLPQRQSFEPAIQAINQSRMISSDDMKATTGVYDSALGNQGNEKSGIAIQRRNAQSQTSNFHFADNQSKSIRHIGRIINDLIPKIYDTARVSRILGEDGSEELVAINQPTQHKGQDVTYSMDVGTYDVTVSTGPSFETKRQEAVASMADMSKAYPQLMQFAGDLMVKNMDWPGAQEVGERLKKMLPPQLQDQQGPQAQIPPQVQAQMQQMGQMIDQLTQHSNEMSDEIKRKKYEIDSKERIAMFQAQIQAEIELAKLGSKESQVLLGHEITQLNAKEERSYQQSQMEIQNVAGPETGAAPMNQQPATGGLSPGQSMGVNP